MLLKVSIPNGMEFYRFQFVVFFLQLLVSIPNGMEFYCSEFPFLPRLEAGFNSQRDGILQIGRLRALRKSLFQFPTGWNSTKFFPSPLIWLTRVSIPNGMEFYFLLGVSLIMLRVFQFPTGWNSTAICRLRLCGSGLFQFPTGWNSTGGIYREAKKKLTFQFPTGWNSTLPACLGLRKNFMFQFPTGWNSTKSFLSNDDFEVRFQFLTGWNSTSFCSAKAALYSSFNSQRDGILQN